MVIDPLDNITFTTADWAEGSTDGSYLETRVKEDAEREFSLSVLPDIVKRYIEQDVIRTIVAISPCYSSDSIYIHFSDGDIMNLGLTYIKNLEESLLKEDRFACRNQFAQMPVVPSCLLQEDCCCDFQMQEGDDFIHTPAAHASEFKKDRFKDSLKKVYYHRRLKK